MDAPRPHSSTYGATSEPLDPRDKATAFSQEAEELVLWGILADPAMFRFCEGLRQHPEWLYRENHRLIWQALVSLAEKGVTPELFTVVDELTNMGKLESAGGVSGVSRACSGVGYCTEKDYAYAVQIVKDRATDRLDARYGEMIARAAYFDRTKVPILVQAWNQARGEIDGDDAEQGHFTFMDTFKLMDAPDLEPLIDGVFAKGTLSMINGASQVGKSFAVIDMAARLALGDRWMGHETECGTVIYIAAEGSVGIRMRLQAWCMAHGLNMDELQNLWVVPQPVQMLDVMEVEAFIADVERLKLAPVWIIVDTLSWTSLGGDENSNADMARYFRGLQRIGQATGAHVTVVHHSDKAGNGFRGASAIFNNVDTVLEVTRDEDLGISTVTCKKQRDGWERFAPIHFTLRQVLLSEDPHGKTSCVIVPAAGSDPRPPRARGLNPAELAALRVLLRYPDGLKYGEWKASAGITSDSSYKNIRQRLEAGDLVRSELGRYVATAKAQQDYGQADSAE